MGTKFASTFWKALAAALLGVGAFAAPAAAQQLFRYTDQEIDPELESWEVEVDVELIRTGASAFAIVPPSGELIAVELSRFEERSNGNALWVGRVGSEAHDTLQFTLHDGHLVGSYSGTVGRQFGLRARPGGQGRVELRELPPDHSCGLDDDRLSDMLTPPPCEEGSVVCVEDGADGLAMASGTSHVDVAEANVLHDLAILPLVTPDAVYHWESTIGSSTETEIIALYDYANMVFRNNELPVRVVAPPDARDTDGQPRPVWAPLALLNDQDADRNYPYPLYSNSASVARLRSRFGADLVELFEYNPDPRYYCGVADRIWLSDSSGVPETARDVAHTNGMSRTNLFCGASEAIFVHEVGHLLGAMHDGVPGISGVYPCFPEGGRAFSCDAYGFFLAPFMYPPPPPPPPPGRRPPQPALGTIMAYSRERVPFFSTTRVPSPVLGGPIGLGPRMANNESVLRVTAPEAALFDEYLPSSPPVNVAVAYDSGAGTLSFSWPALPFIRGDLEIWYMLDPYFSEDLSKAPMSTDWKLLPVPYSGTQVTGVGAAAPDGVDLATDFAAFVVCLTVHRLRVCSEPAVAANRRWTAVASPAGVSVSPSAEVPNLVSVEWDDSSNREDGYKVQVRAGSSPWQEPGESVQAHGHLVPRNEQGVLMRAYLWDLDQVGTGNEEFLHFRVCAVRRWAEDGCSDPVVVERAVVEPTSASVGFGAASVSVNEGDTARITVRLSEAVSSDVTLRWSTADGSATAGNDYVAESGTLTIASRQTTADLTVQTLTDSVVEGDETFRVVLDADFFGPVTSSDFSLDPDNAFPYVGITYANGRFYVLDNEDKHVYAYDGSGNRASSYDFALDPGASRNYAGLTYANGRFYAVHGDTSMVHVWDSGGNRVGADDFSVPGSGLIRGIAYGNGRFYVLDERGSTSLSEPHRIRVYDRNGNPDSSSDFDLEIASNDRNANNIVDLVGLEYANGRFFVLDGHEDDKVYAYDSNGRRASLHDFDVPADVAGIVYAHNRFYLAGFGTGKVYAYGVSSRLPAGVTFGTATATVTIVDQTPLAPTNLSGASLGPESVRLTWTDNSSTETGFEIEHRVAGAGSWAGAGTVAADVTTFDVVSLSGGTTYEFRVRALQGGGQLPSPWSNIVSVLLPSRLMAPTDLRVRGGSWPVGTLAFVWKDNSADESGYRFEFAEYPGGDFAAAATYTRNATSAVVSGLVPDRYYRFRVVATGPGQEAASDEVIARSTSPPEPGQATDCHLNRVVTTLGQNGRFEVSMCLEYPNGSQTDAFDYRLAARDSGLLYFLDRDNAEVLLKVLDFCSYTGPYGGNYWVFAAPVTTLGFRLYVKDGQTGSSALFQNPTATTADSGIRYTSFPCSGTAAGAAVTEVSGAQTLPGDLASATPAWLTNSMDAARAAATATCTPRSTGLTLKGGYRVSACWEHTDGSSGDASNWDLDSEQSGILYFFDRNNAEVLLKVLDGCRVNGHRWVFVAPVTDLGLRLRVTAPDGTPWDYENAVGAVASPRSDTAAFSCN